MMSKGKAVLLVLALTGFARVAIIAIPLVGIYFGVNSEKTEQVK